MGKLTLLSILHSYNKWLANAPSRDCSLDITEGDSIGHYGDDSLASTPHHLLDWWVNRISIYDFLWITWGCLALGELTRLARLTTSPDVKMNGVAMATGLTLSGFAFTWFCIASWRLTRTSALFFSRAKSEADLSNLLKPLTWAPYLVSSSTTSRWWCSVAHVKLSSLTCPWHAHLHHSSQAVPHCVRVHQLQHMQGGPVHFGPDIPGNTCSKEHFRCGIMTILGCKVQGWCSKLWENNTYLIKIILI